MNLRQLHPEDVSTYMALRLRGLQECPEAFTASHAEEVDTPMQNLAARLAPEGGGAVWGWFEGDALGGIVGVYRERPRQVAHKAIIWGMYVAPEFRRRGVARALIARAVAHATESMQVRSIKLSVNARNAAAKALYQSMGFETYGTERGFMLVDGALHDEDLMMRQVR